MRALWALCPMLAAAAVVAGCGSSSSNSSVSGTPGADTGSKAIAAAKSAVATEQSPWTQAETHMPTSSAKAAPGKSLIAVSCSIQIEGCRAISQAHVEAAKALGWHTQLLDGKGDAQGWTSAIQAAIQQHPNVIALGAILPTAVTDVLKQAHAAGIKIVCTTCGATTGQNYVDFANGDAGIAIPVGHDSANYALAAGGKQTDALVMYYPEFGTSLIRRDAFLKEYKALCAACKVQTIAVKISEWGTTLPGRIQTILQQNPNINWIFSPADETAVDAANAIKASGLTGKVHVVGGNGELESFQRVATDPDYTAVVGTSYFLAGWEAIDNANRLVQSKPVAPLVTQCNRLFDQSNVKQVPRGQYYNCDFDFKGAYKKLWGV